MARKKTLRTLPDLQRALESLVSSDVKATASKHVVYSQTSRTKSQCTSFVGEIYWSDPPDGGKSIYVYESGDTLLDAYIAVQHKLKEEIEERARKRKLTHDAELNQRAIEHKPKRLEHTLA